MPRIVMIGAGSTVFAKAIIVDVLSRPALADSHFVLVDIDPDRLATSEAMAHSVIEALGGSGRVSATVERSEALAGADFVVCMVQVGGYEPSTVIDFEIPKRYGLRQTIGDTLGIGGIFRALRTIPVLNAIAQEMESLCPNALLINYTNPMAMLCWATSRASSTKMVGLCHSVQGTARQLSEAIGVPVGEVDYLCAGINHMAFYLRFEHRGVDLYPAISKEIAEGRVSDDDRVRYELLTWLGYFVTESSEHFSEYCPWFIRRDRPELIETFGIPLDEYPRRCVEQAAQWEAMRRKLEIGGEVPTRPSIEYAATIVESMTTGAPSVIYGNVPNTGLIDNLPTGCCVEVPCLIDRNGVQPTKIGAIPPQLAALIQTNVNVQALTVEAALTRRRAHVYHAAMLDPHTSQDLALDHIHALVDDMFTAHGDMIPPMA